MASKIKNAKRYPGGFQPFSSLEELEIGDIVRGQISHRTFVVTANYGTHVTAVDTQDITNPNEWKVLKLKP